MPTMHTPTLSKTKDTDEKPGAEREMVLAKAYASISPLVVDDIARFVRAADDARVAGRSDVLTRILHHQALAAGRVRRD